MVASLYKLTDVAELAVFSALGFKFFILLRRRTVENECEIPHWLEMRAKHSL